MRPSLVLISRVSSTPRSSRHALAYRAAAACATSAALLGLGLCLGFAHRAVAADPAANQAAKGAANVAPPVAAKPAAKPTPAFRAAMKRFLVAQNIPAQMGDQMTYWAAEQILSPLASQGVAVTEPMQLIVLEDARKEFGKRFGDVDYLTDLYAGIYAQHFNEKEIAELATFWESPVAQKLYASSSAINQAFDAHVQPTLTPMLSGFQTRIEKRLKEAGFLSSAPMP